MAESKGAKDTDDAPKGGGGAKGGDDKADTKGGGGGGFEVDTECDDWRALPIYKGQALSKGDPLVVLRSDGAWKYAMFHSLVGDTLVATVRRRRSAKREGAGGGATRPRSLSLTRARSSGRWPRTARRRCTARPTGRTSGSAAAAAARPTPNESRGRRGLGEGTRNYSRVHRGS